MMACSRLVCLRRRHFDLADEGGFDGEFERNVRKDRDLEFNGGDVGQLQFSTKAVGVPREIAAGTRTISPPILRIGLHVEVC